MKRNVILLTVILSIFFVIIVMVANVKMAIQALLVQIGFFLTLASIFSLQTRIPNEFVALAFSMFVIFGMLALPIALTSLYAVSAIYFGLALVLFAARKLIFAKKVR
jgi:hypothetical protein